MTHGKSEGGMKYAVEDFGPSSETASWFLVGTVYVDIGGKLVAESIMLQLCLALCPGLWESSE